MSDDQEMAQMQRENPQAFQIIFDSEVAKKAAQITNELVQAEMKANAAKQDPLVRIKQQEVDLRAMDMQRKAEETQFKQEQENQRQANKLNLEYDRLSQQDEQSDKRLDIAERKLEKN